MITEKTSWVNTSSLVFTSIIESRWGRMEVARYSPVQLYLSQGMSILDMSWEGGDVLGRDSGVANEVVQIPEADTVLSRSGDERSRCKPWKEGRTGHLERYREEYTCQHD